MIDTSLLFEPLEIRGRRMRNRIVMPPMVVNRGIDTSAAIAWYGAHARGGVALVIVEATDVDGFSAQHTADSLALLVDAIHEGGALAAIQLFPGVRGQRLAPAELDKARIEALVVQYAQAAELCARAGFDGVEIHGAHGFLLNQFFSPTQNTRRDAFGATLGGRMLLAVQIVRAVRSALPDDRLLFYRHTPVGPGYTIEESLELAAALVEEGVDVLDLSPSSIEAPGDRAAPFRVLGVPVITVNDLDQVDRAVQALREGRADLVAVGRGLIADEQWPMRVREGALAAQCAKCNHCYVDLDHGVPVGCVNWHREQR